MQIDHLNTKDKIILIAEIGNNHEGSFDVALEMIQKATEAGADCVKFQTITPELLVSCDQSERLEKLKSFQFSFEQFQALKDHADACGTVFFSTPFDIDAAKKLAKLQPAYKIASSDNTFWPLIDCVARQNKPTLISTGCLDMPGVEELASKWTGRPEHLALLHCVSAYPVPPEEVNLGAIPAFMERFPELTIGYSDHTLGIETALEAGRLGARIIEKHFTLDHHYSDFRDHQLSANPDQLAQLAADLKKINPNESGTFKGAISKDIQPCEAENITAIRRSIAANKDLKTGHRITEDDLCWVRPGTHLPPGSEGQLIGRKTKSSIKMGQIIDLSDVI